MTAEPVFDARRRTWCYLVDRDRDLAGAAMNCGGTALDRQRAAAGQADSIPPGSQGLLVLPFVQGERDLIWSHAARWQVIGRRPEHTPAHVARATMEAVGACVTEMVEAVTAVAGAAPGGTTWLTGGIVRARVMRQILCNQVGVPLRAVEAADASATGAALFAWGGLGHTPPRPAGQATVLHPDRQAAEIYRDLRRRLMDACARRGWLVGA
jgi:gluconokinase